MEEAEFVIFKTMKWRKCKWKNALEELISNAVLVVQAEAQVEVIH